MNLSRKKGIILAVGTVLFLAVVCGVVAVMAIGGNGEGNAQEQLSLGERYLAEMDYERAVAAFEMAIELEPRNIDAYVGLARAYEGLGDMDMLLEVLEEARDVCLALVNEEIALPNGTEEIYQMLAERYEAVGRNEEVYALLEEALTVMDTPKLQEMWEEYAIEKGDGIEKENDIVHSTTRENIKEEKLSNTDSATTEEAENIIEEPETMTINVMLSELYGELLKENDIPNETEGERYLWRLINMFDSDSQGTIEIVDVKSNAILVKENLQISAEEGYVNLEFTELPYTDRIRCIVDVNGYQKYDREFIVQPEELWFIAQEVNDSNWSNSDKYWRSHISVSLLPMNKSLGEGTEIRFFDEGERVDTVSLNVFAYEIDSGKELHGQGIDVRKGKYYIRVVEGVEIELLVIAGSLQAKSVVNTLSGGVIDVILSDEIVFNYPE